MYLSVAARVHQAGWLMHDCALSSMLASTESSSSAQAATAGRDPAQPARGHDPAGQLKV